MDLVMRRAYLLVPFAAYLLIGPARSSTKAEQEPAASALAETTKKAETGSLKVCLRLEDETAFSASQSRLSSLAPPARLPRVLVPLYASFVRDLSGDRPRKELANTLDASLSPYRLICQGTCALIEGANGERPFQRGLPIAIRPRAFVTLLNSILLPLSRSLSVPRARPGSAIRQVFVFCGVVLNVCIRTDNMQHKKESLCLTMSQHWGPKDPSSWRSFSAGVIFDLAPLPQ